VYKLVAGVGDEAAVAALVAIDFVGSGAVISKGFVVAISAPEIEKAT
jgi:hypothetical protein